MTPLSQGDSLAFKELDATPSSPYQLSKSFYLKDACLPHLKLPLLEGFQLDTDSLLPLGSTFGSSNFLICTIVLNCSPCGGLSVSPNGTVCH